MTKYGKFLGFLIFSILTLSIYGVSQFLADSGTDHDLKFTTLEGDAAYLNNLQMTGSASMTYTDPDSRYLFEDGTFTSFKELGILERLDMTDSQTYNRIKAASKSFARGKSPYGYFAETDDQLIYTDTNQAVDWSERNTKIIASVLDKETKKQKDVTLSLPDSSTSSQINLSHAYIDYPMVYYTLSGDDEALSVYSTDLEEESPELTLVNQLSQTAKGIIDISYSPFYNGNTPFIEIGYIDPEDYAAGSYEIVTSHVYDYRTDQFIALDLPEESYTMPSVLSDDEKLYLITEEGEDISSPLQVSVINEETSPSPISIEKSAPPVEDIKKVNDSLYYSPAFIHEDTLYTGINYLVNGKSQTAIQVNDLKTGDLLYLGVVEPKEMDIYYNDLKSQF